MADTVNAVSELALNLKLQMLRDPDEVDADLLPTAIVYKGAKELGYLSVTDLHPALFMNAIVAIFVAATQASEVILVTDTLQKAPFINGEGELPERGSLQRSWSAGDRQGMVESLVFLRCRRGAEVETYHQPYIVYKNTVQAEGSPEMVEAMGVIPDAASQLFSLPDLPPLSERLVEEVVRMHLGGSTSMSAEQCSHAVGIGHALSVARGIPAGHFAAGIHLGEHPDSERLAQGVAEQLFESNLTGIKLWWEVQTAKSA